MICLSLWFITLCLRLYCISITKMSDMSITVIYHAMSLTTVLVSLRWVICLSLIYHAMSLTTVSVSLRWVIYLSLWFIMVYCTVSVSLRWVICLSLWFITLCLWLYCISITKMSDMSLILYLSLRWVICLWLYCISITKMSDMSITVIYHAMSLTTVLVSLRWVICLSLWFITLCLWLLYQYH